MAVPTADTLLDRLAESGLVPADAVESLRRWAVAERPGLGQVAQEIITRGLLTRYQLREVAAGRAAGLTVGPYLLLDLLGEGGMGRVFRGRHIRMGREVAVKLVRPERLAKATTLDRFLHEVRVAARLQHPNVVMAFDADVIDGAPYYAMEFVPGADLGRVVEERGPLPVGEACGYVRQAADGLQHAADLGLVHRDVKPTNLLLTPDGRIKVLDLGLALLTDDPGSGSPNRPGTVVGSPDFLAPEQARHSGGVDTRADVYALGCTLFFLLTGRPPFGGDSPMDKVRRHLTEPPPSLLADRPDVPPELDTVVKWMLAKDPADRPQSPAAVSAALAPFAPAGSGRTVLPPLPLPAEPPPFGDLGDSPAVRPRPSTRATNRRGLPLWVYVGMAIGGGMLAAVCIPVLNKHEAPDPHEFTNTVGMKLVRLDGGTFTMGDSGVTHEETIVGPFYIGTTEVTHGQFLAVMGQSPARWPTKLRDAKAVPVDSVTLAEGMEFCRRLTARDPRRSGWAYRLPTEAEWEFAARAGTTTQFWAGDRIQHGLTGVFTEIAADPAFNGVERGLPYPAGSTQPNPFGLHEVCGNLWEWTADGVARGGSWREPMDRCRSASRRVLAADLRADDVGFRVVYGPSGG